MAGLITRPFGKIGPKGLAALNDIDRQFDDLINDFASEMLAGKMAPAVDVSENEDNVFVTTDLPGVDKENVDITVNDGMITIQASQTETEDSSNENKKDYVKERRYKEFARSIKLPTEVTEDGATAKLENGVLEVTLPKIQANNTKKITVE